MTISIRTSRLAMLGAIGAICALSGQAIAQEGPQGLRTTNLGQTLTLGDERTVSQDIDINFDGIPDFVVKITTTNSVIEDDLQARINPNANLTEAAYILSLRNDNPFANSLFATEGTADPDGLVDEALIFGLDDVVGPEFLGAEGVVNTSTAAVFYAEFSSRGETLPTIGPFDEIGSTGFIGFASFDPETEDTNFGFLEITRGSVSFGTLGFQQTANLGATVATTAAVPLPAPLALLGFAIAGLFGLRRFGKS